MVSATGSRYREFEIKGFSNFVLIACRCQDGFNDSDPNLFHYPIDRKPTSEWWMHKSVQSLLIRSSKNDRVILHTHPTDWIVISSSLKYKQNKAKLEAIIRKCLPELDLYFPNGIGLLPYAIPGTKDLAHITLQAAEKFNAIVWERHGAIIIAEDINSAFDRLEILSKAAEIYLKTRH